MFASNARVCTVTLTVLVSIWSCDCGDLPAISDNTIEERYECPPPTKQDSISCKSTTFACGQDMPCGANFMCCFDGCVNLCVQAKLRARHGGHNHGSELIDFSQNQTPPLHTPASIAVAMGTVLLTDVLRRHFV